MQIWVNKFHWYNYLHLFWKRHFFAVSYGRIFERANNKLSVTQVESTTNWSGKVSIRVGNRLVPMNGWPGSCPSMGIGASGASFYQMPFLAPTIYGRNAGVWKPLQQSVFLKFTPWFKDSVNLLRLFSGLDVPWFKDSVNLLRLFSGLDTLKYSITTAVLFENWLIDFLLWKLEDRPYSLIINCSFKPFNSLLSSFNSLLGVRFYSVMWFVA